MRKAFVLIAAFRQRVKILKTGLIFTYFFIRSPQLFRILAAAVRRSDLSNITYVNKADLKTFHWLDLICLWRLSRVLHGKTLICSDIKVSRICRERVAQALELNWFCSKTFKAHEDFESFQRFVTNLYSADYSLYSKDARIFVFPICHPFLIDKWNGFLKQEYPENIFYNLGLLSSRLKVETHCFIYLSEHRVEAIETRLPGGHGIKRSGLLARSKLSTEKQGQYIEGLNSLIRVCKRSRSNSGLVTVTDVYDSPLIPSLISAFDCYQKVYGNYFLKCQGQEELIRGMDARQKTEYKNSLKNKYQVCFEEVPVEGQHGGAGCSAGAMAMYCNSKLKRTKATVLDEADEIIGGIEVHSAGEAQSEHYYTQSMVYQYDSRRAGAQTFAIVEYIKAHCESHQRFNFLDEKPCLPS